LKRNMIKRISSEELKKVYISEQEIEAIRNFNEDFSDPECPPSTDEELAQFRPAREVHPEWFKPSNN